MNIQLRKRHQRIWPLLSLLVAAAGFVAWDKMPENPIEDIPMVACPSGITICEIEFHPHDGYPPNFGAELNIQDSVAQLRVEIIRPLKSALTLVYWGKLEDIKSGAKLLGQVSGMGTYEFHLTNFQKGETNFFLYDAINQRLVSSIFPFVK